MLKIILSSLLCTAAFADTVVLPTPAPAPAAANDPGIIQILTTQISYLQQSNIRLQSENDNLHGQIAELQKRIAVTSVIDASAMLVACKTIPFYSHDGYETRGGGYSGVGVARSEEEARRISVERCQNEVPNNGWDCTERTLTSCEGVKL